MAEQVDIAVDLGVVPAPLPEIEFLRVSSGPGWGIVDLISGPRLFELHLPADRGIGMDYEKHAILWLTGTGVSNSCAVLGSTDLLSGRRSDGGFSRHGRWGLEDSPDQPRHFGFAIEGPNNLCGPGWRRQGVPRIGQTGPNLGHRYSRRPFQQGNTGRIGRAQYEARVPCRSR